MRITQFIQMPYEFSRQYSFKKLKKQKSGAPLITQSKTPYDSHKREPVPESVEDWYENRDVGARYSRIFPKFNSSDSER